MYIYSRLTSYPDYFKLFLHSKIKEYVTAGLHKTKRIISPK